MSESWIPEDLRAALSEHRRAIAAESGRDFTAARAAYARALDGFARAWSNPDLPRLFGRRLGELKLTELDVAALGEEFTRLFPRWLVEFHVDRLAQALATKRMDAARLHASALHASRAVSRVTDGVSLEACQGQVIAMLMKEEDLRESPRTRERALLTLDRILQADPHNAQAQDLAREGYAAQLASLLFADDSNSITRKQPRNGSADRLLMDRSGRKLRRYLRGVRGRPPSNPADVCRQYLVLASYLATNGSRGLALRMARRGRRLDPGNEDARKMLKRIRRRRNAKR